MKWNHIVAAILVTAPVLAFGSATFARQLSAEDFAKTAAMSDMFEIQSGHLAAKKAQTDAVQSFGQKMVDEHTETSEDLRAIMKDGNLNVQLPTKLDEAHQGQLDTLKNSSSSRFDQAYTSQQIQAHQKAVKLFEDYSRSGDNEALKQWAGDTLPTLQEHLKDATALNEDLKASAAKTADASKARQKQLAPDEKAGSQSASNINFVTRQKPNDWSAQALIGRTVENAQDENLGEINNVILDERGSVVAVTIGVGGFLGIGEKNVGVPFDALEFRVDERGDKPAQTTEPNQGDNRSATRYDSEHGNVQIVLSATHEQLENAPQFVWLGEQIDERASGESVTR